MRQPVRLFHVSEEPGITEFVPRPGPDGAPVVWAICDARLQNYLLPRDCPRVTFTADPATTQADKDRFLGGAQAVVAIEAGWFARCLTTTLYLYEFDPMLFRETDAVAGYYQSSLPVRPVTVHAITNGLKALLGKGVELRILSTLWYLREAVLNSSLAYSIIRMRNAAPPPPGFITTYPVTGIKPRPGM